MRTKPAGVSSDASHQGVETRNEQGKYVVVIFTRDFFVTVCTLSFNVFPVPARVTHQRSHFSHCFRADFSFVDLCRTLAIRVVQLRRELFLKSCLFDSDP